MFKDHFSNHAASYADARPMYPQKLFDYLTSLCDEHALAWDCATGNGQAAVMLAERFKKVIATDASETQIAHAKPKPNIEYRVATAEASGISAHTVDLITVAQALHWFNFDNFFKEVKRVLKPNGILAVWCYELLTTESKWLDQLIMTFYKEIVGSYWPKERQYVEEGYRTIEFPFEKIKTPKFFIQPGWDLLQLCNYLSTWSAVKYYEKDKGENPVETWLKPQLKDHFQDLNKKIVITIPLDLIVRQLTDV